MIVDIIVKCLFIIFNLLIYIYVFKIDHIRHYVYQFMKQIYSNYLLPTSVSLWSPEAL